MFGKHGLVITIVLLSNLWFGKHGNIICSIHWWIPGLGVFHKDPGLVKITKDERTQNDKYGTYLYLYIKYIKCITIYIQLCSYKLITMIVYVPLGI